MKEYDEPSTEMVNGKTNYIFMVDGSRTTTLSDAYMAGDVFEDQEPLEPHCPCMAEGHYYMIDGTKILPLTYTLGYECKTGVLRTWSKERKLWSDSAGAHFDHNDRKIRIRYSNGCQDIFTIFKNTAIASIRKIAERNDGSKVAFLSFSGENGELYGVTDYTTDYKSAVQQIKETKFYPGSRLSYGIDRVKKLYDSQKTPGVTKVFIMGDGRNSDIEIALKKAQELRKLPHMMIYSACMGREACIKGQGYHFLYAINGSNEKRFWKILTNPAKDMAEAFASAIEEKFPEEVRIENRSFTGKLGAVWEYYEDSRKGYLPQCSHGTFLHTADKIQWILSQKEKEKGSCRFYVRLKEAAKYVAEEKEYEVIEEPEFSGVIQGGLQNGQPFIYHDFCNFLSRMPSELEVTKVQLQSGISSRKKDDEWYVKGGSENILSFSSFTEYASQFWKPEWNRLYERSFGIGDNQIPEREQFRSENFGKLKSNYSVTLNNDGETREYYPQASAGSGGNRIITETFDKKKKITLICDAIPPTISGTVPDVIREDTILSFSAEDEGSGVRKNSFLLEIENVKTGEKKIFTSSGRKISWKISLEDSFYTGNIRWSLSAEDCVTNRTIIRGLANIRMPKSEETIEHEIRTRIL